MGVFSFWAKYFDVLGRFHDVHNGAAKKSLFKNRAVFLKQLLMDFEHLLDSIFAHVFADAANEGESFGTRNGFKRSSSAFGVGGYTRIS